MRLVTQVFDNVLDILNALLVLESELEEIHVLKNPVHFHLVYMAYHIE